MRVRRRPAAIRAARIVASSSRSTIMRVTVIGGGHGCYAAAADLHEKATRCAGGGATPRPAPRWLAAGGAGGHRLSRHPPHRHRRRPRPTAAGARTARRGPGRRADRRSAARHHARRAGAGLRRCWRTGRWCSCRPAPSAASCSRAPSARPATARRSPMPRPAPPPLARKHGQRVVISGYATRLPTGVFPFGWPPMPLRRLAQAYPSVEPAGDGLSARAQRMPAPSSTRRSS